MLDAGCMLLISRGHAWGEAVFSADGKILASLRNKAGLKTCRLLVSLARIHWGIFYGTVHGRRNMPNRTSRGGSSDNGPESLLFTKMGLPDT